MDLKDRYYSLLFNSNVPDDLITKLWNELKLAYTEAFRKYHNLDHLSELFSYYEIYKNEIEHQEELQWAIFYHDIVYNIWKKDNELKSAEKAEQILRRSLHYSTGVGRIYNLILSTKTHEAKTNDEAYMIDFDLAILGQSAEVYNKYANKIRKEYSMVPMPLYRKGRKRVLKQFLEKQQIYQTEMFISKYEEQAKVNLNQELNTL
ncbi:HD domain-containing protein [Spongiivirga citrea]|uniref:N-methyl-D-aspartate receptor NMDAR2C subunit n=1 Tax=Spongiivirga citrea TaxID=1481457 RepID=A0A6M0CMU5_9FLAO|nr:hypothetical protein [Spongiivirga citrea]NER17354.1 hypothetical protein [Spongiivirga citrea]